MEYQTDTQGQFDYKPIVSNQEVAKGIIDKNRQVAVNLGSYGNRQQPVSEFADRYRYNSPQLQKRQANINYTHNFDMGHYKNTFDSTSRSEYQPKQVNQQIVKRADQQTLVLGLDKYDLKSIQKEYFKPIQLNPTDFNQAKEKVQQLKKSNFQIGRGNKFYGKEKSEQLQQSPSQVILRQTKTASNIVLGNYKQSKLKSQLLQDIQSPQKQFQSEESKQIHKSHFSLGNHPTTSVTTQKDQYQFHKIQPKEKASPFANKFTLGSDKTQWKSSYTQSHQPKTPQAKTELIHKGKESSIIVGSSPQDFTTVSKQSFIKYNPVSKTPEPVVQNLKKHNFNLSHQNATNFETSNNQYGRQGQVNSQQQIIQKQKVNLLLGNGSGYYQTTNQSDFKPSFQDQRQNAIKPTNNNLVFGNQKGIWDTTYRKGHQWVKPVTTHDLEFRYD